MKEEQVFLVELKRHLKDPGYVVAPHIVEAFRGFVTEMVDSFLDGYANKDLAGVEQMLKDQRKLRKQLTGELREHSDEIVVISSKYVQTYNLMNKMVQNEKRRRGIADTMSFIEQSYSHTRAVLRYLYRHTNVQHKILSDRLDIPKSTLSDLLKVLEMAGCVERMQKGKFSFFNLTVEGRKYVRENINGIDREVVIDQRAFRSGVQELVEVKTDCDHRHLFSGRGYTKNMVSILETDENGIARNAKWRSCAKFALEGMDR